MSIFYGENNKSGSNFAYVSGLITSKRTSSPQEIDHVIATNYFGHFLLTELLLSHLNKSIFGGVVVNITSDMTSYMGSVDVIQPQKEFTKYSWDKFEQYYMNESYATSKKALEMHSQYLASACIGSVSNTRFFSANPGKYFINGFDQPQIRKFFSSLCRFICTQSRLWKTPKFCEVNS